ncbi:MAG: hypothetical protein ABIZ70_10395 [Gemmatimonadales bacterium]
MFARALVLLLLGGALVSAPAASQSLGLPVINHGVPTGINLAVDAGFSNADAGKATTVGASASVGLGFVGVTGTIARYNPKVGDGIWAPGVSGSLRLFGGPLIPIKVTALVGVSHWSVGGTKVTHVPVSLGIAATIPSPGFAIKPWVAPRIDIVARTFDTGDVGNSGESHFGISGGIDFTLLSGISLRAAYDRMSYRGLKPSILSFGVGFQP